MATNFDSNSTNPSFSQTKLKPLLVSTLSLTSFLLSTLLANINPLSAANAFPVLNPIPVAIGQHLDVGPIPSPSLALTFTGIAVRRFQPISASAVDVDVPGVYTDQIEIGPSTGGNTCTIDSSDPDCQDEWIIPVFTGGTNNSISGNQSNLTENIGGQYIFRLVNNPTATGDNLKATNMLFKSAEDTTTATLNNNLRTGATVFRLSSDFLYRTPNNVEWRLANAQDNFYRLITDNDPPIAQILADGLEIYTASFDYNSGVRFALRAKDDETSPTPTDLRRFRHTWFREGTIASCAVAITSPSWNNTIPSSPAADGFYDLNLISPPVNNTSDVGVWHLCFEVQDNQENSTLVEGIYSFTLPTTLSMSCFDPSNSSCLTFPDNTTCRTVNLTTIDGGVGTSSLGSSPSHTNNRIQCHITTNATAGYDVSLNSLTSTNLQGQPPVAAYSLATLSSGSLSSPISWPSPTNPQWGIRLHSIDALYGTTDSSLTSIPTLWGGNSSNPYTSAKWSPLTTISQLLLKRRGSDMSRYNLGRGSTIDDNLFLQVGAESPASNPLPNGTYSSNIRITASAVDSLPTIMQLFKQEHCDQLAICHNGDDALCDTNGSTITLTDLRDSKTYRVRKFEDNNCWMIDNLAYGGGTGGSGDYCAAKTNYGAPDYWRQANSAANTTAVATNGLNPLDGSRNTLVGHCVNPAQGANYCATTAAGRCGYLYNWPAAIQDVQGYDGNDFQPAEPTQGICPQGWQLPTNAGTKSFYNLHTLAGTPTTGFWQPVAENTLPSSAIEWQGVFSGYAWGVTGSIGITSTNGQYWSSSQDDARYVHSWNFYLSFYVAQMISGKPDGRSVRCVLK